MKKKGIKIERVYCLAVCNIEDFPEIFGTRNSNVDKGAFLMRSQLELLISNRLCPQPVIRIAYNSDVQIIWQYIDTRIGNDYVQHTYAYTGYT